MAERSDPLRSFPLALAGLIDIHLDDGATIAHVVLSLRLQLAAIGEQLDPSRRYLPELLRPFDLTGGSHGQH